MILVIGGRSRTGQEVIRLLQADGTAVRVLTRAGEAPAAGVEEVTADLSKPDTLDKAMEGADSVFLLCGTAHDEAAWLRRGVANKNEVSVRALAYITAGHELHHRGILEEKYFGR